MRWGIQASSLVFDNSTLFGRNTSSMQRFHGAFTGGFNAGHNNTVGSEEGFNPSTFVSSRSNRALHKIQSASNFVDAEDGLLGGILSAKNVRSVIDVSN